MRRKKHKSMRRIVRYYQVTHGFRTPFKVLLDGNFVHAVESAQHLGAPQAHVEKLLGATCKLFVTRCVMNELRAMGKEFAGTTAAARKLALAHCDHESAPLSAADCILSMVGSGNRDHFWVATQDRKVRKRLAEVPGAPAMFLTVNGFMLEAPPGLDLERTKAEHDKTLGLTDHEREALKGMTFSDIGIKTSVRFKKQGAKGPNPLSVKKKEKKKAGAGAKVDGGAQGEAGGRKRKRRRGRAKSEGDGAGGD
ncbi:unnamed protein product [Pedinophyceae sp. YPF-701]|nr:unnamed protein product [Pedinophyceae sp. YPF-701]